MINFIFWIFILRFISYLILINIILIDLNNYRSNADPESDLFFTMKKAPRETKSYDHLQYGSHIILNVKDKVTNNFKKLWTKLRISEKLIADEMGENEYNINCMFWVLPTCQYVMHDKVLSFIEEETIPENIDVEFENFSSEVNSNSSSYSISIGKNVKYEETFQLYQDSSKRFLAFYSRNVKNIDKIFDDKFFGDECYYLGFSDYPGSNTHFKFETVANYQSEIDGYVKKDHFVYLTAVDQMKTHYLYSIENELVLTETHKTPISFKVIRDSQSLNAQRTVSRSNVFLLAFANDNLYLNSLHELNKKTGEYYEKSINFNRWSDINNIDFNGWWQIEYLDVPTKVYFRNFNSGKFLAKIENSQTSVFSLVNDKEEATAFELTSITNDVSDVSEFTENEIFKIKIGNKDTNDNYVCVEETDVNELFFGESETDSDIKRCILGSQSEENVNDSFKIIIPKEEKYLEISIWIDSREYIQLFIDKLELSSDFLLTLVYVKDMISQDFIKIVEFIQNQLSGKIRHDFTIGQLVPHRQDMVAKVGIIFQIWKLLTLISEYVTVNNRDSVLRQLSISPDEFDKFENLLEVIVKTLDLIIIDNPRNISQSLAFVNVIQEFWYIRGWTDLLINIFKNKEYELNKKEIHSEFIYKRIYETERFKGAIFFFIDNILKEREHRYIRLLRKFWIINENPLPLVQNEILNRLYLHDNSLGNTLFKIIIDKNDEMRVQFKDLKTNKTQDQSIIEFFESGDIKSQNFLLEQLTLEADMWYGRNEKWKEYFRDIYPWDKLVSHISNENYCAELRGIILRLINYIYIDDNPHKLQKLFRIFKAYESPNQNIVRIVNLMIYSKEFLLRFLNI